MEYIAILFMLFIIAYILDTEILAAVFCIAITLETIQPTPNNVNLFIVLMLAIGLIKSFLGQAKL